METIAEAKQYLRQHFDDGVDCPCCGRLVKLYRRSINTMMAVALIELDKISAINPNFHHWSEFIQVKKGGGFAGDFSKLRFWELVDSMEKDPDETNKRTSGMWRITDLGRRFARGQVKVPQYARLYDNRLYGMEGEYIHIKSAIQNRFDYAELMGFDYSSENLPHHVYGSQGELF